MRYFRVQRGMVCSSKLIWLCRLWIKCQGNVRRRQRWIGRQQGDSLRLGWRIGNGWCRRVGLGRRVGEGRRRNAGGGARGPIEAKLLAEVVQGHGGDADVPGSLDEIEYVVAC